MIGNNKYAARVSVALHAPSILTHRIIPKMDFILSQSQGPVGI
jgi:hypothetical protein